MCRPRQRVVVAITSVRVADLRQGCNSAVGSSLRLDQGCALSSATRSTAVDTGKEDRHPLGYCPATWR
jgi:hypothetical protein